ncbi:MAG: NAD(P)H-hydrate epimerase, partial [Candidatus Marinimicrobia bacterium]|nr:NAD(P)H-hydrate epimerase [Candidatus Neomarinimicrobiota bacterium]
MRLLTSDQARFLDQVSMDDLGISSIDLMRNAGKRIASKAKDMVNEYINPTILIICGKGNNGGDGYAAALVLHHEGLLVQIHSIVLKQDIINGSLPFYGECVSLGIP